MQASMFNVRVPLENRDDVFLMNTFTDAQLIVSRNVLGLLARVDGDEPAHATDPEPPKTVGAHGLHHPDLPTTSSEPLSLQVSAAVRPTP